jgi:hypothetical protein
MARNRSGCTNSTPPSLRQTDSRRQGQPVRSGVGAVPALAGTSSASARSDCAKLRATMGAAAFSQAYATFGACVSRYGPIEQLVTSGAKATCAVQQADPNFAATHDGKTFDQYYGKGKIRTSSPTASRSRPRRSARLNGRADEPSPHLPLHPSTAPSREDLPTGSISLRRAPRERSALGSAARSGSQLPFRTTPLSAVGREPPPAPTLTALPHRPECPLAADLIALQMPGFD